MTIIEDSPKYHARRPADIRLRKHIIKATQGMILAEEDRVMSGDEVLSRALGFYSRHVPFKA